VIRVNLLPHVREQRATPEGGQLWLLAIMGVVVLEIVVLFFFHQTKEDELADVRGQATRLNSEIKDIQAIVKDHAKVKAKLAELRAREEAIAQLQGGRTGPTSVLLELSHVLTPGRGPTIDDATRTEMQNNPMATFNPAWDTRRVWLTSFSEAQRNVRLEGVARDASDVYEFAQRLKLSRFFKNIRLLPGKQQTDKASKVELVGFALQVKAIY
jgi:type IV pilus assembly protein PilN